MNEQSWLCACGRRVPALVDVCRCGMQRQQRTPRVAPVPDDEPSSASSAALTVGGVVAMLVLGWSWYASFGPAEAPKSAPALVAQATPAALPTALPTPEVAVVTAPEPPAAPWPEDTPAPSRFIEPAPGSVAWERDEPVQGSGESDMDRLRRKSEVWRGQYRGAKEAVDRLEREVAELEEKQSRIASIVTFSGPGIRDPNVRTEAERTVERLPRARAELEQARQRLSQVEEGARRDGVGSGQLY